MFKVPLGQALIECRAQRPSHQRLDEDPKRKHFENEMHKSEPLFFATGINMPDF